MISFFFPAEKESGKGNNDKGAAAAHGNQGMGHKLVIIIFFFPYTVKTVSIFVNTREVEILEQCLVLVS